MPSNGVVPGTIKRCIGCGNYFEQTAAKHLFCSGQCRDASRYKNGGKERQRIRLLDKMYDLTPEMFRALEIQQEGRCALCREYPDDRGLFVDHDHVTEEIRGLLDSTCNLGLGHYEKLKPLAEIYLARY